MNSRGKDTNGKNTPKDLALSDRRRWTVFHERCNLLVVLSYLVLVSSDDSMLV